MKEEISFLKKIALLLGVLFLLVSLYILRVPIVLLIGSVLLAFFAAPILLWTEKRRYPDWFGLILFYGAFGIFVLLLLFTLIPLLVEQFLRLSQSLPSRMDVSFAWLPESLQASLRAYVSENIPSISSFLIQTSKVVASKTALFLSQSIEQVIQFFLMSIGSILFILERREIEIFLRSILPEKYMNQIKKISTLSIGSIASWYI
jgi:predicted PurR-regulated permease PerM